jgi:hypothetical protein
MRRAVGRKRVEVTGGRGLEWIDSRGHRSTFEGAPLSNEALP